MNTQKIALLISVLVISLSACEKQEELLVNDSAVSYAGIDASFIPFVERFINEGAKKGFDIDLASRNITIQFIEIDQQNVSGMCSYDGHFHNDITIDITFWKAASDLEKEFILFHELGHCYLYRAHRSGAFQNGICTSIMRGADPGCYDAYTLTNRDYYINELFSLTNDRTT
jgi:hypothetical protein